MVLRTGTKILKMKSVTYQSFHASKPVSQAKNEARVKCAKNVATHVTNVPKESTATLPTPTLAPYVPSSSHRTKTKITASQ